MNKQNSQFEKNQNRASSFSHPEVSQDSEVDVAIAFHHLQIINFLRDEIKKEYQRHVKECKRIERICTDWSIRYAQLEKEYEAFKKKYSQLEKDFPILISRDKHLIPDYFKFKNAESIFNGKEKDLLSTIEKMSTQIAEFETTLLHLKMKLHPMEADHQYLGEQQNILQSFRGHSLHSILVYEGGLESRIAILFDTNSDEEIIREAIGNPMDTRPGLVISLTSRDFYNSSYVENIPQQSSSITNKSALFTPCKTLDCQSATFEIETRSSYKKPYNLFSATVKHKELKGIRGWFAEGKIKKQVEKLYLEKLEYVSRPFGDTSGVTTLVFHFETVRLFVEMKKSEKSGDFLHLYVD